MLIKIHVHTDAKKEVVLKKSDDALEIYLCEPAEDNQANDRIIEIVREIYPGMIARFVKGHHSNRKIVELARSAESQG